MGVVISGIRGSNLSAVAPLGQGGKKKNLNHKLTQGKLRGKMAQVKY